MAPAQKRKSDYASDDGFVAKDNTSDDERPSKLTKSAHFAPASLSPQVDPDGNPYWEISKNRRVTISSFKGKRMVSVRGEYYQQDGKMLPGKKGISMTMEQYGAFIELLPFIEQALKESGEKVPRPRYEGVKDREENDDAGDEEEMEERKANIEATSDEDEG